MKKLFQTLTIALGILGATFMVGCSKQQNVDSEAYLHCNKTSNGLMAEIESGYFYVFNSIVYYADKTNLELWVPVCNKPDCIHSTAKPITNGEGLCNGHTTSNRIIQKDGKIYDTQRTHGLDRTLEIIEIATDGSGAKTVYEVPWDEESMPSGGSQALYQDCVLLSVGYLDEKGYDRNKLLRVRDDENGEVVTETLYEAEDLFIISGNVWWSIRGDNVVVTDIDWDKDSGAELWRNLWRIEGDELVKLNIPNEINLLRSYLSGNELTYYEQNDGFYKLNLDTGEKQLITESQLKDGNGCVFSNELILEYNYHNDYTLEEEISMKLYDGKEWKDVQLPEEMINAKEICAPRALASDRIFFAWSQGKKYTFDLYYMMLDEKNPKIVHAGQISDKPWEEEYDYEDNNNTGSDEVADFEEITVFNNEDGALKVTGARANGSKYEVDLFFEVGESGREYNVTIEALINGIQCHTNKSLDTKYSQKGTVKITFDKYTLKEYGVTDVYSVEEFTDIELTFYVNEMEDRKGEEILKKSVHIYPQGEEAVVHYTREPQEHDLVVVENDKVKVTVVGYEMTKVENDTPIFFVENKTDSDIRFQIKAGSINGAQDNTISGLSHEAIQAGACAFVKVVFAREGYMHGSIKPFWEEHVVTEIGTLKTLVSIENYDIGKSQIIGEPFVEEVITLYPQGEEQARDDAILSQATDVVLVDNSYIKVTLVGYQEYDGGRFLELVVPNFFAKIIVENKTDEILYSQIPVYGNNGIINNSIFVKYTLLPGDKYLQVVGGTGISEYQEGKISDISKIEFLYQILDKDKNTLCQEYVTVYPLGEEQAEIYQLDTSTMEEVLIDDKNFTIAVNQYANGSYDEENPYPNCAMNFAFINKTDQMICFEMEDIVVNGMDYIIEENDWTIKSFVVFPNELSFVEMNVYEIVENANMTELEEVEMTFKVYAYNDEDGTLGEKLGSKTVKFGPN